MIFFEAQDLACQSIEHRPVCATIMGGSKTRSTVNLPVSFVDEIDDQAAERLKALVIEHIEHAGKTKLNTFACRYDDENAAREFVAFEKFTTAAINACQNLTTVCVPSPVPRIENEDSEDIRDISDEEEMNRPASPVGIRRPSEINADDDMVDMHDGTGKTQKKYSDNIMNARRTLMGQGLLSVDPFTAETRMGRATAFGAPLLASQQERVKNMKFAECFTGQKPLVYDSSLIEGDLTGITPEMWARINITQPPSRVNGPVDKLVIRSSANIVWYTNHGLLNRDLIPVLVDKASNSECAQISALQAQVDQQRKDHDTLLVQQEKSNARLEALLRRALGQVSESDQLALDNVYADVDADEDDDDEDDDEDGSDDEPEPPKPALVNAGKRKITLKLCVGAHVSVSKAETFPDEPVKSGEKDVKNYHCVIIDHRKNGAMKWKVCYYPTRIVFKQVKQKDLDNGWMDVSINDVVENKTQKEYHEAMMLD